MRHPFPRPGAIAGALVFAFGAAHAQPAKLADLEAGAAAGDAAAQYALALRHQHAEGVPRDLDRAFDLHCAAGRQGHAAAALAIGRMFLMGDAAPRDDAQAAAWFVLARDRGVPQADALLRMMGARAVAQAEARCGPPEPAFAALAPEEVKRLVARLAPSYGLDPALVLALIRIESGFAARAVSPKNAHGLMQLLPETAERFGVRDIFDPEQNVAGGMTYLRWLLDRFGGNLALALAAYNAGEKAVERHAGVPPFRETRDYLRKFAAFGFAVPADARAGEAPARERRL